MASAPSAQQQQPSAEANNAVCLQVAKLLAPLMKRLSALEKHASSTPPTPPKPAPKPAPNPSPKPSPKPAQVDDNRSRSRTPEDVKQTRERYRHDVLTLTDACWLAPRYGSRLVVQNVYNGKAVDSYSFDKVLLQSFTKAVLRENDVPYNGSELRRMHNFLRARRGYHLRNWRRLGTHANMYCGGTLSVEPARLIEMLQEQSLIEQREQRLEARRLEELNAKKKNKKTNKEAANTDVVQEVAPSMPEKKKDGWLTRSTTTALAVPIPVQKSIHGLSMVTQARLGKKHRKRSKRLKKSKRRKKNKRQKKSKHRKRSQHQKSGTLLQYSLVFFNTPTTINTICFIRPLNHTDTNSKRTSPQKHRTRAQGFSTL